MTQAKGEGSWLLGRASSLCRPHVLTLAMVKYGLLSHHTVPDLSHIMGLRPVPVPLLRRAHICPVTETLLQSWLCHEQWGHTGTQKQPLD